MKKLSIQILACGAFAAFALVLVAGTGAQTPPPPAAPMMGHDMHGAAPAHHDGDMKAECQAMMAKHQAMQDQLKAMDVKMDGLVADMNAATTSTAPDAMEKPMAAVINELVVQRKAQRAMMMEMQPEMMKHMEHHMDMHGKKGEMDCPMMKMGDAPDPMAMEKKPKT